MSVFNDQKRGNPYTVSECLHFLPVWSKFDTLFPNIFANKKWKSADQFISVKVNFFLS